MEEGKEELGVYRESKRKYRRMCEEQRKEEVERWEKELEGVRTEGQVWKAINRERKRRRKVNERIKMVEWDEHFKGLLGGVEWRVRRGGRSERGEDGEEEIGREEIGRVIRNLKEGKAGGENGIRNVVWKLGGSELEEWLWALCNRVWRREGWLEGWREGVVLPALNKGRGTR